MKTKIFGENYYDSSAQKHTPIPAGPYDWLYQAISESRGLLNLDKPTVSVFSTSISQSEPGEYSPSLAEFVVGIISSGLIAESFVNEIRYALALGNYKKAQQLASKGSNRFPENEELAKAVKILAPPKITTSKSNSQNSLSANRDWIKENRQKYQGEWVA